MIRSALVTGARSTAEVEAYLPDNYKVVFGVVLGEEGVIIEGEDIAGWTLEDYVIPRLASGLLWAREVF